MGTSIPESNGRYIQEGIFYLFTFYSSANITAGIENIA